MHCTSCSCAGSQFDPVVAEAFVAELAPLMSAERAATNPHPLAAATVAMTPTP